jgi:hypothetical protein
MLKIKAEQVGHLTPERRRSLRDRLIGHAREALGARFPWTPQEAQAGMDALLAEALAMGLSWETHIAQYAVLRLALGEDALERLGYAHDAQKPKAEIAAAFEAFLDGLPQPIWAGAEGAP